MLRMENTLRVRRAERHVSQLEVAQALTKRGVKISQSRYWQIENGHVEPTEEEQDALAEFFGTQRHVVFPPASAAVQR